jgi:hypothetical protein
MIIAAAGEIAGGHGVESWFHYRIVKLVERSGKVSTTMFGKHTLYSSEELIFLRRVLDEAIDSLPASMRTPDSRSKIAKRIMDCAATGERDRVELRIAGLAGFREVRESAA